LCVLLDTELAVVVVEVGRQLGFVVRAEEFLIDAVFNIHRL
jgi:hypothetical protein